MHDDVNWLLAARKKLHLTQQELADAIGVAKNYIWLIEAGRKPLTETVRRSVEKLDTASSVSNLTQRTDVMARLDALERRAKAAEDKLQFVCAQLESIIVALKKS